MSGELLHPRARRVWRGREEMVLRLLDEGLSYTEMAARLGIGANRLRVIGERAIHRRTDPKVHPVPGSYDPDELYEVANAVVDYLKHLVEDGEVADEELAGNLRYTVTCLEAALGHTEQG